MAASESSSLLMMTAPSESDDLPSRSLFFEDLRPDLYPDPTMLFFLTEGRGEKFAALSRAGGATRSCSGAERVDYVSVNISITGL